MCVRISDNLKFDYKNDFIGLKLIKAIFVTAFQFGKKPNFCLAELSITRKELPDLPLFWRIEPIYILLF